MIKVKFNDTIQFFTVGFSKAGNIITLTGNNLPEITTGFKTYKMTNKQLGDFSAYNTVYRVLDNGIQYSCDGSVWVKPVRNVEIKVAGAPAEMQVKVLLNGEESETVVLNEENEWTVVKEDVAEDAVYTIEVEPIEGYDVEIAGTSIVVKEHVDLPVEIARAEVEEGRMPEEQFEKIFSEPFKIEIEEEVIEDAEEPAEEVVEAESEEE